MERKENKKAALPGELLFPFNMVYGFAFIISILLMGSPIGEG